MEVLGWLFTMAALSWRASLAGRWFSYRQLRNPGLVNVSVSNHWECISKCSEFTGCSGLSYQFSTGTCLLSTCNFLDLFFNTGWNTHVLTDDMYVEGRDFPAAKFEWMLTDSCGSANLAATGGPTIRLSSVSYSPSLSAYGGNAATFNKSLSSSAVSDQDATLNNPMGNTSLTVMMWAKWAVQPGRSALLEFYKNVYDRGIIFWFSDGGLLYRIEPLSTGTSGCTQFCNGVYFRFTIAPNTWYHIAFVYDAPNGFIKTYLNASLVATNIVGQTINKKAWDTVKLGTSTKDATGNMDGILYCYKVFNLALTTSDVDAHAKSCIRGKMRLSTKENPNNQASTT